MDNLVKLIEENKTYSNELQTEVLPLSIVRTLVEQIYISQINNTLIEIQSTVNDINKSIRDIAEGDTE
jgi:hypothetical protein